MSHGCLSVSCNGEWIFRLSRIFSEQNNSLLFFFLCRWAYNCLAVATPRKKQWLPLAVQYNSLVPASLSGCYIRNNKTTGVHKEVEWNPNLEILTMRHKSINYVDIRSNKRLKLLKFPVWVDSFSSNPCLLFHFMFLLLCAPENYSRRIK